MLDHMLDGQLAPQLGIEERGLADLGHVGQGHVGGFGRDGLGQDTAEAAGNAQLDGPEVAARWAAAGQNRILSRSPQTSTRRSAIMNSPRMRDNAGPAEPSSRARLGAIPRGFDDEVLWRERGRLSSAGQGHDTRLVAGMAGCTWRPTRALSGVCLRLAWMVTAARPVPVRTIPGRETGLGPCRRLWTWAARSAECRTGRLSTRCEPRASRNATRRIG